MAYGVVLGGMLQLLWQVPSLREPGFHFHFDLDWRHPGLRQIFRLMIPGDCRQRGGPDQRDGEHKFRVQTRGSASGSRRAG